MSFRPTYELTGVDLDAALRELGIERDPGMWKLSIALDGGVKVKVNELSWSPPIGTLRDGTRPQTYTLADVTDPRSDWPADTRFTVYDGSDDPPF